MSWWRASSKPRRGDEQRGGVGAAAIARARRSVGEIYCRSGSWVGRGSARVRGGWGSAEALLFFSAPAVAEADGSAATTGGRGRS